MTERNVKTEAIVLRSIKYGETGLILTLFGSETGKISAIAKGARKTSSRMRGPTQLFSRGNFVLYKGKSLYTVTQCEGIEPFLLLRHNLSKFAYASYCTEIVRELLPEGEVNLPAYKLLAGILTMMSVKDEQLAARLFDARMLALAGFQPELYSCVKCGNPLEKDLLFSSLEGGMVCCSGTSGIAVGRDTLEIMRRLSEMNFVQVNRLKPGRKQMQEMETIMKVYWETVLEKRLNSVEFIERMRNSHKVVPEWEKI